MGAGLQRAVAAALRTQGEGCICGRNGYPLYAESCPVHGKKSSKYRNCIVGEDGQPYDKRRHKMRFASIAEWKRYGELKLLERAGQITALRCQPRYPLVVNGKTACTVIWDFYYREHGGEVCEDVKSPATAKNRAYRIKHKMFEALHPAIDLRVIFSGRGSSKKRALPRRVSVSKRVASSLPT